MLTEKIHLKVLGCSKIYLFHGSSISSFRGLLGNATLVNRKGVYYFYIGFGTQLWCCGEHGTWENYCTPSQKLGEADLKPKMHLRLNSWLPGQHNILLLDDFYKARSIDWFLSAYFCHA